jgi:hypothetical protein
MVKDLEKAGCHSPRFPEYTGGERVANRDPVLAAGAVAAQKIDPQDLAQQPGAVLGVAQGIARACRRPAGV